MAERFLLCRQAGIDADRLLVDPGFGFGKSLEHNLALLRNLAATRVQTCPLLVGLSRKSMIGLITGQPVGARVPGSLAALMLAVQNGADLVRVHDVQESADVLCMLGVYNAE